MSCKLLTLIAVVAAIGAGEVCAAAETVSTTAAVGGASAAVAHSGVGAASMPLPATLFDGGARLNALIAGGVRGEPARVSAAPQEGARFEDGAVIAAGAGLVLALVLRRMS